jgi:hypothetical protein
MTTTPRKAGYALFPALACLVVVANRQAYGGYFRTDDFLTFGWTRYTPLSDYLKALLTPLYIPSHFRPAGHIAYWILDRTVGLNFPVFVALLQALHILNLWLVWRILRSLSLPARAAAAGTLLFAFHMAVLDAYWKPQFVFDVVCATFSLACILAYLRKRWVVSFVCFWLAYKSKELAVMLPAVLACYELWLGERRWKRLVPFALVSISFGLQAMLVNRSNRGHSPYELQFTPKALWTTVSFYASKVLMVRYAGLALAALPLVVRSRQLYFGLAMLALFLAPVLALPERLLAVYLYLPLAGLAIAFAALAAKDRYGLAFLFLAFWLPWNYFHSASLRNQELALALESRAYVAGVREFMSRSPDTREFLFEGWPQSMGPLGIRGALSYLAKDPPVIGCADGDDFEALLPHSPPLLIWDGAARKLTVDLAKPDAPLAPYLDLFESRSIRQLETGWLWRDAEGRRIGPRATARLFRPPGARTFQVTTTAIKPARLTVLVDGTPLGAREFSGRETKQWDVAAGPAGVVEVELRSEQQAAIAGFGFQAP